VLLPYTGPIERARGRPLEPPGQTGVTDHASRSRTFLRGDRMLRNAIYLIMNSGVQAALGFAFWIIAARFFDTTAVGCASSLISATTLLSILGLLGLNTTFIRYLPVAAQRNRLITAGIVLVAVCSGVAAVVYVLLTPRLVPSVAFVDRNAQMAVGVVLLTAATGINLLTDSVFIAAGKSSYNVISDGLIGGSFRIILILTLAGGGAFSIFGASSIGYAAAAIVSLLFMVWVLKWRPSVLNFWLVLKPVLRFSGANYVGNVCNLLPGLVVPLIVINRLGATTEAYYYVAFQLAAVLYTAIGAVEQAFLAEGASSGQIDRAIIVRSLRLLLAFCIPAFLLMLFSSHFVLAAFGAQYGAHAGGCLIVLASGILPQAANNWFLTVLRLSNRLQAIVWSNVVYGAVVIGLAWTLAPHGLTAVSLSWPIGTCAAAIVAGVAAMKAIGRNQSKAHGALRTTTFRCFMTYYAARPRKSPRCTVPQSAHRNRVSAPCQSHPFASAVPDGQEDRQGLSRARRDQPAGPRDRWSRAARLPATRPRLRPQRGIRQSGPQPPRSQGPRGRRMALRLLRHVSKRPLPADAGHYGRQ
jgi:O-antigen/teichoic acid export membrane protein